MLFMNKKLYFMKLKSLLFVVLLASLSMLNATNQKMATNSVAFTLSTYEDVAPHASANFLQNLYGANDKFQFVLLDEYNDDLGYTHINFQQNYNGIPLEGCMVIVHAYAGRVVSINGQVASFNQLPLNNIQSKLSLNNAQTIASNLVKSQNNIVPLSSDKIYARITDEEGNENYVLSYKFRISSIADFIDKNIYIDAIDGKVLKNNDMLQFAAPVEHQFNTLYSGEQTLRVTPNENGNFMLLDTAHQNYTFQGKVITSSRPTTKEELVDHINEMVTNTPYYQAENDDWSIYYVSEIGFDSVNSKLSNLNTNKKSYEIALFDNNGINKFRSQFTQLYDTVPPFSKSLEFSSGKIERDSTYNFQLIYHYYDTEESKFIDSIVMSQNVIVSNLGRIDFTGDSVYGYFNVKERPKHALDVHYSIDKAYLYYKNVHNRASYDGKNSPIYQFVDFDDANMWGTITNNAFAWASEPYFIATGSGDGFSCNPFASLDLLAHEFTHLVVATNGRDGIELSGEAGAINEAIADCMGVSCDFYTDATKANWQIAEGVMLRSPNMRDMSNPKMAGGGVPGYMVNPQPDTYGGEFWINPNVSLDNGGIHFNNGVFNYWYYLVAIGDKGENDNNYVYDITGLGIDKAEKLLMRMILNYLIPTTKFSDARSAALLAANDLWGNKSTEYNTINEAWMAVGVSQTTANDDIDSDKVLNVYSSKESVIVEAEIGDEIVVYNTLGQIVASLVAEENLTTVSGLKAASVVIVTVNGVSTKVIVK